MFKLDSFLNYGSNSSRSRGSATEVTRRNVSQEGIDKIMRDILGSEDGLASLAVGENISGGSASTTKTQLSQDLVTKLAGELALINAETITTKSSEGYQKDRSFQTGAKGGYEGQGTVICTELVRQQLLDKELYDAGTAHFQSLPSRTIRGYQCWAKRVVPLMKNSPKLSKALLPIAKARYLHITNRKHNLVGFLTVWIAQPLCYVIGYTLEILYGHGVLVNT
jgi:hypothetical protein